MLDLSKKEKAKRITLIKSLTEGEESGIAGEFDGMLLLKEIKEKYRAKDN